MADLSASAGEFVPGGGSGVANGADAKEFVPAASAPPFVPGGAGGGGNGGMSLAAPPFVPRVGGSMDGENEGLERC